MMKKTINLIIHWFIIDNGWSKSYIIFPSGFLELSKIDSKQNTKIDQRNINFNFSW